MSRRASAAVALALLSLASSAHAAGPTVAECLNASEKGQELRDAGKLSRASERFTTCSAATCPAPVRASCSRWLETLVEGMPSVIVVARSETEEDVTDAALVVDGTPRDKVSGRPIPLDPGPHAISVTAPGYDKAEQNIVVNLSEKNRFVRFRLTRSAKAAAPPVPQTERPAAVAPSAVEPAPRASSSTVSPLVIGLGGLALVSVGASLVIGLGAKSELDDLHDAPCATTRTCSDAATSDLETRFIIADVALGVAVVAAAAAAWFWFTTPKTATTASRRVGPAGFSF